MNSNSLIIEEIAKIIKNNCMKDGKSKIEVTVFITYFKI